MIVGGRRIKYVRVGIEDVIQGMTGAQNIGIQERISMTKTKYSFQRMDLKYDECEQSKIKWKTRTNQTRNR